MEKRLCRYGIEIPKFLIDKYSTRGPRYTSYPPASSFYEQIDRYEVEKIWSEAGKSGKELSIYLHIPFCRKRCLYCGCHTSDRWDAELMKDYVNAMIEEISISSGIVGGGNVLQMALGGGSPNVLSHQMLEKIFESLKKYFSFSDSAEISIELDPRIMQEEDVEFFLELGINRFSFGIQDFDRKVQEIVGRVQDEEKVRRLVKRLRSRGIEAINFDLIYGLPGQTLDSFSTTIDKVIEIKPSRIAVFGYAHVPWIHPHQKQIEKSGLPDTELRAELAEIAAEKLIASGYIHIGLDHFATAGDELVTALNKKELHRNFMGYTTRKGLMLLAFGASAISAICRSYIQNEKDIQTYISTIFNEKRLPWKRGFILSDEDMMRRELIMELFCNLFVDIEALGKKYGLNCLSFFKEEIVQIEKMHSDGLCIWDGRSIKLTEIGRFFVRNVCMVFDRYLESDPEKRVHSKTI